MTAVLSLRALNRTLLSRQMLLRRRNVTVSQAVEHLIGIQAQEPQAPYIGLWSRLTEFDPTELSEMISSRRAVRGSLMRCTVHLASAEDWQWLWPTVQPVLARAFKGSPYNKQLSGADLSEVLTAGRGHLAAQPHTRPQLAEVLRDHWPAADPASLAFAASLLTPVVQTPPRGLWRTAGQARWTTSELWLGEAVSDRPQLETLVARYLKAFGPATVQDIQAWSGLTKLAAVASQMDLVTLSDEHGRTLLDVADGHLEDAESSAPARLLAPFDNVILSHADRSRIVDPATREVLSRDRLMRAFLVDGFVAGTWALGKRTLDILPARPLSKQDTEELRTEGERLLRFAHPRAGDAQVVIHTRRAA